MIIAFSKYSLLLIGLLAGYCYAWNESGHRQMAYITFSLLTTDTQNQLISILRQHPRFKKDFLDHQPVSLEDRPMIDQNQWLFSQMAVWPDQIRRLPKGFEYDRYVRKKWHYVNLPINLSKWLSVDNQLPEINLLPLLDKESHIANVLSYLIKSRNKKASENAIQLCWLIHLVADIHQPLHVGNLMVPGIFKRGDLGGNLITVGNSNLHQKWDSALGYDITPMILKRLANEYLKLLPKKIFISLDLKKWLEESYFLALSDVYGYAIGSDKRLVDVIYKQKSFKKMIRVQLTREYRLNMQQVAEQRMVLSAYRLAHLLNERFKR